MARSKTRSEMDVHKCGGYTTMLNHHLRNKELSLKAVGLLSKMLSLPPDWDYSLKGLATYEATYITTQEENDDMYEGVHFFAKIGIFFLELMPLLIVLSWIHSMFYM